MKRLLNLLTATFVAAAPILAGNSAVGTSDKQTSESAKVNVDGNGIILKGRDAVAFFAMTA
jgi:hypothetical protein